MATQRSSLINPAVASNGSILIPFRVELLSVLSRLEGRKTKAGTYLSVIDSGHNRKVLSDAGIELREPQKAAQPEKVVEIDISQLRPEQTKVYNKLVNLPEAALLCETGTGKTAISGKLIASWLASGAVDKVLIIGSLLLAKQWKEEAIGKWIGEDQNSKFMAVNYAAFISKQFESEISPWLSGNYGVVLDESHEIKNPNGKTYAVIRQVMQKATRKLLMTGTVTGTKNPVDIWAQYRLINEGIIGCKFITTFKAQYCILGGFTGRQVVGAKDQERLKSLIEPFTGFLTREHLGLGKIHHKEVFDLTKDQIDAIKTMKKTGELFGVNVPASQFAMKIQQISCGYFLHEDRSFQLVKNSENPRLLSLKRIIDQQRSGRWIIWCAFQMDFEILRAEFPNALEVHGQVTKKQKSEAIDKFLKQEDSMLLAHPRSAGAGLNLQVCNKAVYYSHTWRAIDRWQSEDRISRIGGSMQADYWDLLAIGGIDIDIREAHAKGKDYLGKLTSQEAQ